MICYPQNSNSTTKHPKGRVGKNLQIPFALFWKFSFFLFSCWCFFIPHFIQYWAFIVRTQILFTPQESRVGEHVDLYVNKQNSLFLPVLSTSKSRITLVTSFRPQIQDSARSTAYILCLLWVMCQGINT